MVKAEKQKKRLVLLDAHAILHRAYHALPDFSSSKGEPTGALYGLSAMLIKIINDLKPDYLVACYDLPGATFRHEAYKEYKAGRKKVDEELVLQMKRSRDVFKAFAVPIYEQAGFEADDILGTIVDKLKKSEDTDIIIASGDMDTLQLVDNDKVRVYTLKKGVSDTITYNEKAVIERFGFKPELLPDYKGLRGDPSDNIVGIKGIGEKTAGILIKKFGTIENIYQLLKKGDKEFLKIDIKPRIILLLKNGEEEALFSKTLATIRRDAPINFELPEKTWQAAFNVEAVAGIFSELDFRSLLARVKSTFSSHPSLLGETLRQHSLNEIKSEAPKEKELQETAIALSILDSNITNPTLDDVLNFGKTKVFKKAHEIIFKELKKQNLAKIFEDIERPLIPVIARMEERGVKIDKVYLEKLSIEYHEKLSKIEKQIFKIAGTEFNVNSPRQLGEILFEKLHLSIKNHKKTGTGIKSTRESELDKLKAEHKIIPEILAYRELQKLLSTYIDTIPKLIDKDGRLHARFLQTGTTTGRMSSQNPNLQNIPIKTDLGKRIRNAFIADSGFLLAALDYSQIELRVAAFLSKDEKLLEIFKEEGDVHTAVASRVFNVSPDKVDREMRRRAKVINFGILYGMGVNALRQNLGTNRAEAQQFYNHYFETFSGLARYLDEVKSETARRGYTETYFGRRRTFEGIRSKIPYIRAMAERMAINAPIQGTQADIIKIAMARIDQYIKKHNLKDQVFLLLQVHDELVYEIKEEIISKISAEIKRIMESILSPKEISGITLAVKVNIGANWGEMH